jgi:DNA polymerase-3 subunit gamma/tau
MSFYRKYRPTNFDEVLGQNAAVATLQSIAKTENIPHAYIFCGGHGTGKTSIARIFAKALGTDSQDIYEMDAASNRGIDEARDLREAIHTMPVFSKYKVYILDEAHMLTKEASNALLKTLEEPPSHIIFILCTTDADKLLSTIRSRCQIIDFKRATHEDLVKQITHVAKQEKIKIDKESVSLIASKSNRSFRDALSNLETVVHGIGEDINFDSVKDFFKVGNQEGVLKVLDAVHEKNIKSVFEILEQLEIGDGFYDEILETLRQGMLVRQKVAKDVEVDFADFVAAHDTLFTAKNLLFLLEKKPIFEFTKEKKTAVMAALGAMVEQG